MRFGNHMPGESCLWEIAQPYFCLVLILRNQEVLSIFCFLFECRTQPTKTRHPGSVSSFSYIPVRELLFVDENDKNFYIPVKYTRQKYGCAISQDTVYPPAFDYRILFKIHFTVTRVSHIAWIANYIWKFWK